MRLWQYALRRVLLLIPVLLGILLISFTLSRVIPSDPAKFAAGPNATTEMIEKLRTDFGLDRPLPEQFVRYIESILQGDLGRSLTTRRSVAEDIGRFFPATLELVITALVLGQIIGIPIGVISARFENRWPDNLARLFTLATVSLPGFWLALVFQLLVVLVLRNVLPITGRFDPNVRPPPTITGLLFIDSILHWDWQAFVITLRHIILPALSLSALALATAARMSRAAMVEAMRKDFIQTARATGLPEPIILFKHALRHALIPVLTMTGLEFTWLMAGSVLVETIFNWPGLGHYIVDASLLLDYNPIMGSMLVLGICSGVTNIIVDIAYAVVDPRIQQDYASQT